MVLRCLKWFLRLWNIVTVEFFVSSPTVWCDTVIETFDSSSPAAALSLTFDALELFLLLLCQSINEISSANHLFYPTITIWLQIRRLASNVSFSRWFIISILTKSLMSLSTELLTAADPANDTNIRPRTPLLSMTSEIKRYDTLLNTIMSVNNGKSNNIFFLNYNCISTRV